MPIIEAMACGVPVVASSHPSLDEACGDAAVRADPDEPEAIAAAIREALAARDELARSGSRTPRRFSWRATAGAHLPRGVRGDERRDRHDAARADARRHGALPARPAAAARASR